MDNALAKIVNRAKTFYAKTMHYGISIAWLDLVDSQKHRLKIVPNSINQKKHDTINKWLLTTYRYFIEEYMNTVQADSVQPAIPKLLWICWWDGIDAMPPIVKACYNSMRQNANEYKITVITKYNFTEYIAIPDHVLTKMNAGIMTVTHFSNIVRMSLLDKYGGLWLDATILVTGRIELDSSNFFTLKGPYGGEDVPRRRWTGNCIGGSPKVYLFGFIREFLCEYWKDHTDMIDYFLYDYSIAMAYTAIPAIKEAIDGVPIKNTNNIESYMVMQDHLGNEFDSTVYDKAITNSVFHKLTWKNNYVPLTSDNKLTLYGYILEHYGE